MRFGYLSRSLMSRYVLVFALHCSALGKATNRQFYQDVEPDRTMGIANTYEEISRRLLLEAEKDAEQRERAISRDNVNRETSFASKLPWEYANYLKFLRRQKEKEVLEALLENPSLLEDTLEESRASRTKERTAVNYPYAKMERYETAEMNNNNNNNEDEQSRHRYASADRFQDYIEPDISGYARNIFRNENRPRYPQQHVPSLGLSHPLVRIMSQTEDVEDAEENYPIVGYRDRIDDRALAIGLEEKLALMNGAERRDVVDERPRVLSEERQSTPDFTYRFDEAKNDDNAFAVKPNDPHYYETGRDETPMVKVPTMRDGEKSITTVATTTFDGDSSLKAKGFVTIDTESPSNNDYSQLDIMHGGKFSIVKVSVPEIQSNEHDSGLVYSSRITNNDVYFIAVVAGCSAAAMFALVLISLTWCRLQRGAKAAADIEYPAYGVTGPNKDVSPSGDQRLAHSAQMYHFQHQKQQIIAMENRTASSRDPGSVSEAESDEENEEGDYTVYECPGLASAGEMEVKNPMFHDDPTSATSSQINHNKEEDHI